MRLAVTKLAGSEQYAGELGAAVESGDWAVVSELTRRSSKGNPGSSVAELPLVLATIEGEVVLQSKRRRRVVKAAEFQTGLLSTCREPDEMVMAVRFPHGDKATGYAFDELNRRKGDLAVVSVAAAVSKDSIRLGVGGVADCPTIRDWPVLDDHDLEDALNAFAWDLGGFDDIHGTSQYRRELVRRMGFRTIKEAKECQS